MRIEREVQISSLRGASLGSAPRSHLPNSLCRIVVSPCVCQSCGGSGDGEEDCVH